MGLFQKKKTVKGMLLVRLRASGRSSAVLYLWSSKVSLAFPSTSVSAPLTPHAEVHNMQNRFVMRPQ